MPIAFCRSRNIAKARQTKPHAGWGAPSREKRLVKAGQGWEGFTTALSSVGEREGGIESASIRLQDEGRKWCGKQRFGMTTQCPVIWSTPHSSKALGQSRSEINWRGGRGGRVLCQALTTMRSRSSIQANQQHSTVRSRQGYWPDSWDVTKL